MVRLLSIIGILALVATPSRMTAQAPGSARAAAPIGAVSKARPEFESRRVALASPGAPAGPLDESRSRARGARNGLLVGILVGAVAGAAISSEFYDDPGVNILVGAAVFGAVGALVGAAIGARTPSS